MAEDGWGGQYPSCIVEAFNLYIKRITPPVKKTHEDVRAFVSKLLDCMGLAMDLQSHEVRVLEGKVDLLIPGRLVVEIKTDLDDKRQHSDGAEQLSRYLRNLGASRGVLTDGRVWEFYRIAGDGGLRLYSRVRLPPDIDAFYNSVVNELLPSIARRIRGIVPSRSNIGYILDTLGTESHLYATVRDLLAGILPKSIRFEALLKVWVKLYRRLYPGLGTVARSLGTLLESELAIKYKLPASSLLREPRVSDTMEEAVGLVELFVRHMYYDLLLRMIATHFLTPDKALPSDAGHLLELWETSTELSSIFRYNTIYMDMWRGLVRLADTSVRRAVDRIVKLISDTILEYDWTKTDPDVFREIYENLLPPDLRHQIGEYYTPDQLIDVTLRLAESAYIDSDLSPSWLWKKVIDPACGSGGFIVAVLDRKLRELTEVSRASSQRELLESLSKVLDTVTCFDVNPVAVTTARLLVFLRVLRFTQELRLGVIPLIEMNIYLADSLAPALTIDHGGNTIYFDGKVAAVIPATVARRANTKAHHDYINLVGLASKLASAILHGGVDSPAKRVLNQLASEVEAKLYRLLSDALSPRMQGRQVPLGQVVGWLEENYPKLEQAILGSAGKSHAKLLGRFANSQVLRYALWTVLLNLPSIRMLGDDVWSTIIESVVIPIMNRRQFDVVIGNPPWLRYNMAGELQFVYDIVWSRYGVAPESHLRTSYDLSVIFYTITADEYLKDQGVIAYIMPRSVIDGKQHRKFLKLLIKGSLSGLKAYAILELDIDPRTQTRLRRSFSHGIPAIVLASTKGLKPKNNYYLVLPASYYLVLPASPEDVRSPLREARRREV